METKDASDLEDQPKPRWTRRSVLAAAATAALTLKTYAHAALPHVPAPKIPLNSVLPPLPLNAVQPLAPRQALPFDLADVRLMPGIFRDAQLRDGAYLLFLEPDRLLNGFLANAGLTPKAPKYGGWESAGVAGHIGGHYLSACSLMYRATGDRRYRARVDYMIGQLALCQQQSPDGFVSAIPGAKAIFAQITANGVVNGWVPWYTMHKLYAGLRDAHTYCGNAEARAVFLKLNDWAIGITQGLTYAQFQSMLETEHGGMAETTADAYAMTGDSKYLDLAHRFTHHAVFDPLAAHKDELDGLHSNTQIPKMIGYELISTLTGEPEYHQAPLFFWETVVNNRSFANGGNGDYEHFFPVFDFPNNISTDDETESCCSYNMLKLTEEQFQRNTSAAIADYNERTILNHILATQEPDHGLMIYMTPMQQGHFKVYGDPVNAMWCCTGTGMENHARYGKAIYFRSTDNRVLYVNLYIPSTLNWHETGMTLHQETRYPEEETTRFSINCTRPAKAAIKLRYPGWCKGMTVTINGKRASFDAVPGSYVTLNREWRTGDVIEARFPMTIRMEALPNAPNKQAVFFGPTLLVGAMGTAGMEKTPDVSTNQIPYGNLPPIGASSFVAAPGRVADYIRRVPNAAQPLTFRTVGIGKPIDMTLIPMYAMHHQRYNFYWSVFTPEAYAQQEASIALASAAQSAIDLRTMDQFLPGNQQSEVDHKLAGANSESGLFGANSWRDARDGGWFSFIMKVSPQQPMELRCRYWGSDSGGRAFDILVDGVTVGTTTLENNQPNHLFYIDYSLPIALTSGKKTVIVKLQAHPGMMAGGLFGCRMLLEKAA